jgi:hypothetical protein
LSKISKEKINKMEGYQWMRSVLDEALVLHDSVKGWADLLYYENAVTTIKVEDRKVFWQDLLANLQSVRDNYSVEFSGMFGVDIYNFVVSQIQPLVDLIKEVDLWLEDFRHDSLYVFKKRLEESELNDLKAKIYESL